MPDPTPHLRGNLVSLRPFEASDITDAYLSWLNDPRVVRYSNQRFRRHDRDTSLQYLQSFSGSRNHFLIVHRLDTGAAIGTMTVYASPHHGTADVGILIGETSAWGRGYGRDAWNTAVKWLLDEVGVRKLTAGAAAGNGAMLKLMQQAGMHLEAVRKAQEIIEGEAQDIQYYARFRGA